MKENEVLTKEQLMRRSKAELVDMLIYEREKWFASKSSTPVYDSIAHADPRGSRKAVEGNARSGKK